MRTLAAFILCFGMLSAAFCAEIPELKVKLAAVRNDIREQWRNILPNRKPPLVLRKRAAAGEVVMLHAFCSGYAFRDGKTALTLKFKMTDPQGKVRLEDREFSPFGAAPAAEKTLAVSNRSVRSVFGANDPAGVYRFQVTVRDGLSGKTAEAEWELENTGPLQAAPGVMDEKELNRYLQTSYLDCRPELAVKAFRGALAVIRAQKEKKKKLNPTPILAAFSFLLADHPVLDPAFRALRDELSGEDLELLLVVEREAALLREPRRKSGGLDSQFSIDLPQDPVQLNVLWSEFLIRGGFEPVRRIAAATARRGWKISPEGFKTIAHPNAEERAALKRCLLVSTAEYSLTARAVQHQLVFFYLETILKRDGGKDPVLQRKIQKILDAAAAARQKKGVQPCGTTTKK